MTLNSLVFHKTGCAKCSVCKSNLTPQNFAQMGDAMYCRVHYMQQFSRSGGKYEPAPETPRVVVPRSPLSPVAIKPATATPKNLRAPPPIPQSMLARQQQQQPKSANRLSAFLNQHSSPEPAIAATTAVVTAPPPAPTELMLEPAQPTKLSAFLGKNTTSLKDIRLAKQQQRPSTHSSSSSSSSSLLSSSSREGPNALFKERMSAFTTGQQSTTSKPQPQQQHVFGGGMSLKERLRAYTSAAASPPVCKPSALQATGTPLAQRMQTYRQATSNSHKPVASPQVPTALIVHDHENENAPSSNTNLCGTNTAQKYREMQRICATAQSSLANLHVDLANIKQQQVYTQLQSEVDKWVTRLDSFATAN
ncbi:hypothetical protein BASA81_006443 [Batrachochytrium salamandrivorans]|nr:hypothetical protein BASA81_006443 [Batrachochytrium salamandrivorans]